MKKILKLVLIAAVITFIGYYGWTYRANLTPEYLRSWIGSFGVWAPFVYILLYAVNTVTLLPPIAILSLTAGLAFGKVVGFLALMAGAMLGTTATFFISRKLGRGFVEKRLQGKFKALDEKLEQKGFATVFFFRAVPLVPYEVLNYVPGLSKITFRDYFFGTLLGLIPGVSISVFFGDSLATIKENPGKFLLAVGAMALMIAIPALYLKFRKKTAS
jgi:uncharacterized membrane protein YdjX (TVP38/TMEM64 family)